MLYKNTVMLSMVVLYLFISLRMLRVQIVTKIETLELSFANLTTYYIYVRKLQWINISEWF